MNTANRGMLAGVAAIVMALCVTAASAQCPSVTITNNVNCTVNLCLYSLTSAQLVCTTVAPGASVTVLLPAGFVPAGAVSAASNRYAFAATGCTVCFSQRTLLPVICCAQVCYDPAACTVTIDPCTSARCYP